VDRPAVAQVGERIRAERLSRGVSLRSLARTVGVSASFVSQIETGKCQPSVSTLYAITTALGVSIEDVFEQPAPDGAAPLEAAGGAAVAGAAVPGAAVAGAAVAGAAVPGAAAPPMGIGVFALDSGRRVGPLVRPDEREVLELDSGVTWQRLGRVPDVQVDFLLVTYRPGSSSSSTGQLMRHAGTEYGYLLRGELTVTLGFDEYRLQPGDAINFPSATPHRYRNDGDVPAVGVWFVVDPAGSG
jgi:quercetin dioxygenase-like cupin family protein/DNA-binding XRE family transcriptional regulator